MVSGLIDRAIRDRADRREGEEHRGHHAEVTDSVRDEGLLASHGRAVARVPERDQEVRARSHAFPAEEGDEQVLAEDEHQHAEDEQVQVQEELRELLVPVHVADRIEMNERANAGDEERHRDAERIRQQRGINLERPDGNPGEQRDDFTALLCWPRQQVEVDPDGHDEGRNGHECREIASLRISKATAKQQDERCPEQRERRKEP